MAEYTDVFGGVQAVADESLSVYADEELRNLCSPFAKLGCRSQVQEIDAFLHSEIVADKMLVLYGLRRTGKTVMMLQEANKYLDKSVYVLCKRTNTLGQIEGLIRKYLTRGKNFFFIDEITFCSDFATSINCISILANMGARIVCAGTDSFGFHMVRHLAYDRQFTVHTTYISYAEYHKLKGGTVDDYIRQGGFFLEGDVDPINPKNITLPFIGDDTGDTVRRYLDTSVAQNILNAFKIIEDSDDTKYEPLYVAYENRLLPKLLTIALNCQGFQFTVEPILKKLSPQSILHPARTLKTKLDRWQRGEYHPGEQTLTDEQISCIRLILGQIKSEDFIKSYYSSLGVNGKVTGISEDTLCGYIELLGAYLEELDVVTKVKHVNVQQVNGEIYFLDRDVPLFSQMGLQYGYTKQALKLLEKVSVEDTNNISVFAMQKLRDEVDSVSLGELLETAVIMEMTKTLGESYDVFKCTFRVACGDGEFDMVMRAKETFDYHIFEVKHSDKMVAEQAKHLVNAHFCDIFTRRYGHIVSRTVLYTGTTVMSDTDVRFINVSDFLKDPLRYLA